MILIKNQAIQTALTGDWNTAIALNQELLKEDPKDIETLNRLAFAFSAVGNIKDARTTYQKVLKIDGQNPIALKNIRRLSETDNKTPCLSHFCFGNIDALFIEESGKTKVVELVNVAPSKILTHLLAGETLILTIKRFKIFILDKNNQYVGVLPDDIGRRLIKFIKGGNTYDAYTKSVENNKVSVFIKETKRSARFKNQPSFIAPHKSQLILDKKLNQNNFDKKEKITNKKKEESYFLSDSVDDMDEE